MKCNSIYRKYRPTTFEQVVGQEHIKKILTNQIMRGQINHSYLFTGTRGTGKTSVAKIFAKAINCLDTSSASPCAHCAACLALADPSNLDIIELDAASNNGTEEIRGIIQNTQYQPQTVRYKVFIIDEVHMLTAGAFNALLKTLEEPPEYCVFILATTELHKVPQTIISRCLVMDFRLLPHPKLCGLVRGIFDDLHVDITDDAVSMIASLGEGSARDALSVAQLCMAYADSEITLAQVIEVLGLSDPTAILGLADSVLHADMPSVIQSIEQMNLLGKPMHTLYDELLDAFSTVLYIKNGYTDAADKFGAAVKEKYFALAEQIDGDILSRAVDIMVEAEGQFRYTSSEKTLLETICLRIADTRTENAPEKLIARIKMLESRLTDAISNGITVRTATVTPTAAVAPQQTVSAPTPTTPAVTATTQTAPVAAPAKAPTRVPEKPATSTAPARNIPPLEAVAKLVEHFNQISRYSMIPMILTDVHEATLIGKTFSIMVGVASSQQSLLEERTYLKIKAFLEELYGRELDLVIASNENIEKDAIDYVKSIFDCPTYTD